MTGRVWVVATEATAAAWAEVVASSGREVDVLAWGAARPCAAPADLEAAVARVHPALLLLTSAEGAAFLRGAVRAATSVPAACVGPRTAEAAHAAGLPVALVGSAGSRELAERLLGQLAPDEALLWLRGREAREEGVERLRAAHRRVEELVTYEIAPAPGFAAAVAAAAPPRAVLVGSSRAAVALHEALLAARRALPAQTRLVASGATTARRLGELGFAGVVAADPPGIARMLSLLP